MKKGLESKIMLQIVSVGIAIILWFIITYAENPTIDTTRVIPIEYTNVDVLTDKGLTVLYSERTPTVTVVLRGKRAELFNVVQNITANVDLSAINTSGSYDIPINVNIPLNTVEIVHKRTPNLNITIEPIVSKDIPIRIQQIGINKQYLVKSAAETENIVVKGANSAVSDIDHATVFVDISNIKQNEVSSYNYSFANADNNEIENPNVITESSGIPISNTVYISKTVPIEIEYSGTVKEDYIITIKNSESLFANIGVAEEFYDDVVSLSAHFPDNVSEAVSQTLSVPITVPDSVYIPQGSNIEIKADITKKQVKELSIPITLQNVPSGLSVILADTAVTAVAKGPADQLDPSLMTASADLTGLSGGTHSVRVNFITPGDVSIKQSYNITVTLG